MNLRGLNSAVTLQLFVTIILVVIFSAYVKYDIVLQEKSYEERVINCNTVFQTLKSQKVHILSQGYFTWDDMVFAIQKRDMEFFTAYFEEMRDSFGLLGVVVEEYGEPLFKKGINFQSADKFAKESSMLTRIAGVLAFVHKIPVSRNDGTPTPFDAFVAIDISELEQLLEPLFTDTPGIKFGSSGISMFNGDLYVIRPSSLEFLYNHRRYIYFLALVFIFLIFIANMLIHYSFRIVTKEGKILTLLSVLEQKDKYTRGHAERVGEYAVQLATLHGQPQTMINKLYTACLCHDLGKIMVSDAILNKKGRLDRREFDIIKQHSAASSELVNRVLKDPEIECYVLHHHERWDGQGYPEGLMGKDIPVTSRIIAVADVLDALTSDRAYRAAMDAKTAFEIIETDSGTAFDPEIVALVRQLIVTA